jgi:prolyl-tRNA synthetase
MRPRLFLRTTEFLWQEGHTAHETEKEAWAEAKLMLDVYRQVAEDVMAMPVHMGRKTPGERFPGAVETLTIEALMRDGKALQAGTSHYLGENFARAYGVTFLGRDGEEHYAQATSWGASTRLVGGLIMAQGDDAGLRLPPAVAPHQVVVVPIFRSDDERARVMEAAGSMAAAWRERGLRVKVDARDDLRPGYKFADWELRGVPVRVEVGPRDLDADQVTVVRRDTGEKAQVSTSAAADELAGLMPAIQQALLADAVAFRDAHTSRVSTYDELRDAIATSGGFVIGAWCAEESCEVKVKQETKATIRFVPFDVTDPGAPCVVCGQRGVDTATWAIAY